MPTVYLVQAGRPDVVIINKKKSTCNHMDFALPANLDQSAGAVQHIDCITVES